MHLTMFLATAIFAILAAGQKEPPDPCKHCDDEFFSCKRSWACFFDPANCDKMCDIQVCNLPECNHKCGYTACPPKGSANVDVATAADAIEALPKTEDRKTIRDVEVNPANVVKYQDVCTECADLFNRCTKSEMCSIFNLTNCPKVCHTILCEINPKCINKCGCPDSDPKP
ncbi:hypothetical protein K505DRAFT_360788 [Melanomma pulvis-pyrius CBS 109.77]|uniref:Extracellular membrane protein CFEM domain-containing protein n=1 Tax=Melanomma pulvis-pyrius CBS 109.77 TaxID=1314802 RepID=A0A6A6XEN3_9PLEO|nr:hypothetical protein K505DRAFT_360788 [Melanomma pulvis-pyrius CBS 109.77]